MCAAAYPTQATRKLAASVISVNDTFEFAIAGAETVRCCSLFLFLDRDLHSITRLAGLKPRILSQCRCSSILCLSGFPSLTVGTNLAATLKALTKATVGSEGWTSGRRVEKAAAAATSAIDGMHMIHDMQIKALNEHGIVKMKLKALLGDVNDFWLDVRRFRGVFEALWRSTCTLVSAREHLTFIMYCPWWLPVFTG